MTNRKDPFNPNENNEAQVRAWHKKGIPHPVLKNTSKSYAVTVSQDQVTDLQPLDSEANSRQAKAQSPPPNNDLREYEIIDILSNLSQPIPSTIAKEAAHVLNDYFAQDHQQHRDRLLAALPKHRQLKPAPDNRAKQEEHDTAIWNYGVERFNDCLDQCRAIILKKIVEL